MNKISEESLIEKIKIQKCSDSLLELTDRHSGLYIDICKKYFKRLESVGLSAGEIVAEKSLVMYKACLSYNPLKNTKFSTWFASCARYNCLNTLNANKKSIQISTTPAQEVLEKRSIENFRAAFDVDFKDYVFDILGQLKDKRIKQVFELRYFPDENKKPTWLKISRDMDVSIQTAINLHQKGRRLLFSKINSKKIKDLV